MGWIQSDLCWSGDFMAMDVTSGSGLSSFRRLGKLELLSGHDFLRTTIAAQYGGAAVISTRSSSLLCGYAAQQLVDGLG